MERFVILEFIIQVLYQIRSNIYCLHISQETSFMALSLHLFEARKNFNSKKIIPSLIYQVKSKPKNIH